MGFRAAFAITAAIVAASLVATAVAFAKFEIEPHPQTGVLDNIGIQPPREELTVTPGQTLTFDFAVVNRLGRVATFNVVARDARPAKDPESLVDVVDQALYGAGSWISIEKANFDLQHGDIGRQTATIKVPDTTGPGSYYGIIQVSTREEGEGVASTPRVYALGLEVFFTIPGAAQPGGKIISAKAPRYVQRKGATFLPVDTLYRNTGNVTDAVGGEVTIRSIFGNTAVKLPLEKRLILRDGRRSFRAVWSDPPWIGIFKPKVQLQGRANKQVTEELGWVVVTPPWYYIAAVLVSLMIPIAWRIRQNRQWRKYLEENEDWDDEDLEDFEDDEEYSY